MKFSKNKPVIHRNKLDAELYFLRKEFERIMLLQAVVDSYTSPCDLTKCRIYKSN
ncbi:hypothetical protein N8955_01185 [bacterium]|nr:hypothetical protein [bacterium]